MNAAPPTRTARHRGRFAPSPTGPLHFGSLVAAVASFLDARSQGGEWLVRVEDVDRPRTAAGAADAILRALERCELHWDGAVVHQSRRSAAYVAALDALRRQSRAYPCACSRREIADSGLAGVEGYVYPGTCRAGLPAGRSARALRVDTRGAHAAFEDRIQGSIAQDIASTVGDFVLRRADGLHAYQLAVVVDDAEQGITDIVRGADLLDSTPRQIFLQRLLGLDSPRYAHVPVAVNDRGEKLSKQTRAPALSPDNAGSDIARALQFLGHPPPPDVAREAPATLLAWATENWNLRAIPRRRTAPAQVS